MPASWATRVFAACLAVSVGMRPVLDTAGYAVVAGVGEAGDVADGDHVGPSADAQVLVGEHAVAQVEAVAVQPLGVGDRADRLDHHVGGKDGAVAEDDAGDVVVAGEAGHARAEGEAHAALLVALQQRPAEQLAERADHGQGQRVDDRHLAGRRERRRWRRPRSR